MTVTDEEHRQHLISLLKNLYRELVVYRAFAEFVKGVVGDTVDVEEILENARHDPEIDVQAKAFFENFSGANRQSLNSALDREIAEYFSRWQPKGKPI
jgi:hypothetical protein